MPKTDDACKKTQEMPQLILIPSDQSGQRIDNFLLTRLKGVPKSHVYRIVRRGEVRVNKGRIKPDYRLQAGDSVRIPPLRLPEVEPAPRPGRGVIKLLEEGVLYEDAALLILNKPSGIAVHGGSGLDYGIIEALRTLRPDAAFLELVHRLDRDTSGCLLIAKTREVLLKLHEMLRAGGIDKHYLALVKGVWRGGRRTVELALSKNMLQSGERVVKVNEEGKAAKTLFEPLTRYRDATLVRAYLYSGRTHQIRVHAAHIGHPIGGDDKYGEREFNHALRAYGLRRLFLHAQSLAFKAPVTGRAIRVSAPLPGDLQAVLARLTQT